MTELPLVSIVIPVYNGTNYLREAIESALGQTYKNIEVIVINDGSTDNGATESIALSYSDRIRYISKENGGVASALNRGIMEMKGEYFSWLSHDDIYKENKIEEQIKFIKIYSDEEVIVFSDYELLKRGHLRTCTTGSVYFSSEFNGLYPLFFNIIHGCTLLIPKKCFEASGCFNETLDTTSDYEMFFRIGTICKFVYLKKYLVTVRVHEKQDSCTKLEKHYDDCNKLWIYFIDNYPEEKILREEATRYIFLKKISNFLWQSPYKQAYKHIRKEADSAYKSNLIINSLVRFTPILGDVVLKRFCYICLRKIIVKVGFAMKILFRLCEVRYLRKEIRPFP